MLEILRHALANVFSFNAPVGATVFGVVRVVLWVVKQKENRGFGGHGNMR